jgi:hypothetical protein
MEDAMRSQTQQPSFMIGSGWSAWATEATHPELPATVVTGQASFEWLAQAEAA